MAAMAAHLDMSADWELRYTGNENNFFAGLRAVPGHME